MQRSNQAPWERSRNDDPPKGGFERKMGEKDDDEAGSPGKCSSEVDFESHTHFEDGDDRTFSRSSLDFDQSGFLKGSEGPIGTMSPHPLFFQASDIQLDFIRPADRLPMP